MATTPEDLRPWLGPAWDELTEDQRKRLAAESDRIVTRYPDDDLMAERDAALSAAVQYLLGEIFPALAGERLRAARRDAAEALAVSMQVAAMAADDGMSEVAAAEATYVDRMTVRKARGKR